MKYKEHSIKNQLAREKDFKNSDPAHWKYWMFYPIEDKEDVVSMDEGGTPLVSDPDKPNLYFKYEGVNPTGSFKDRGSSVEITHAKKAGVDRVACASSGNMGASIASYCARAGIRADIYVPISATFSKKKQIKSYGAKLHNVFGNYTKALLKTQKLWSKKHIYQTGDYVYRNEGQKSVVFEIIDQLGFKSPSQIILPIGMGNLFWATYKGLTEFKEAGLITKIPKLIGVQSIHCNPVETAFRKKLNYIPRIEGSATIASAISTTQPNYGDEALYAVRKTRGKVIAVTDDEIRVAKGELAHKGLYVEASSAAAYAGYKKLRGLRGKTVVILTGHGLKDTLVK